jgi:hypothetical protein
MPQATAIEDAVRNLVGINNLLAQTRRDSAIIAQQWDMTNRVISSISKLASGFLVFRTQFGQQAVSALNKLKELAEEPFKRDVEKLQRQKDLLKAEFETFVAQQRLIGNAESAIVKERINQYEQELSKLDSVLKLEHLRNAAVDQYNKLHSQLTWKFVGYVELLRRAASLWTNINAVLAEARSRDRGLIFGQSLAAARDIGASMHETASTIEALVARGRDLTGNLEREVKTALLLQKTYGMSADDAAELVASFGVLGVNTEKVADNVARVAEQTALSAREAARLSANLARAFAFMRPGQAAGIGDVAKYLTNIEGNLYQLTGAAGDLTEFYKRAATTIEGMGVSQMLGVSPEELSTEAGAEKLVKGLSDFVERVTGGMDNASRTLALRQLGEVMGLDINTLGRLNQAIAMQQKQANEELSLRKKFQDQSKETLQSLRQLANSLTLFAGQVLTPILKLLTPVISVISELIKRVSASKPLMFIVQTLAIVYLPMFIKQLAAAAAGVFILTRQLAAMAKQTLVNTLLEKGRGAKIPGLGVPGQLELPFPDAVKGKKAGTLVGAIEQGLKPFGAWVKSADAWLRSLSLKSVLTSLGSKLEANLKDLSSAISRLGPWLRQFISLRSLLGASVIGIAAAIAGTLINREISKWQKALDIEFKSMQGVDQVYKNLEAARAKEFTKLALQGKSSEIFNIIDENLKRAKTPEARQEVILQLSRALRETSKEVNQQFIRDVLDKHGKPDIEKANTYAAFVDVMKQLNETLAKMNKNIRDENQKRDEEARRDEVKHTLGYGAWAPSGLKWY